MLVSTFHRLDISEVSSSCMQKTYSSRLLLFFIPSVLHWTEKRWFQCNGNKFLVSQAKAPVHFHQRRNNKFIIYPYSITFICSFAVLCSSPIQSTKKTVFLVFQDHLTYYGMVSYYVHQSKLVMICKSWQLTATWSWLIWSIINRLR